MKRLTTNIEYDNTINLALDLNGEYDKSVIFHCYWHGSLNEKHFFSILSCYYFNVYNNKHKIILWLENNTPNTYNIEIAKYAEIRYFDFNHEKVNTNFITNDIQSHRNNLPFYSDVVRLLLLYNYGGVWFDLDCFFLRNFDPLFYNFENEICVYQWEVCNFPNNAIVISLQSKSESMKKNIEFIIERNRGWGFQQANLTFDLPLNMLVLPCSWFDGDWIKNNYNIGINHNNRNFFKNTDKQYTFDNFFKGSFTYHWHNGWDKPIDDNSVIMQLVNCILQNILQ